MSEQNKMTYQDAYDLLTNQIYAPVFFEKLASDFGISPTTEDEARELLVLAGKLQQLHEAEQVKQANERTSLISAASKSLDGMLHGVGASVPKTQAQLAEEAEIKEAASKLSQIPQLRDAALLYQDAMTQLVGK